MRDAQIRRWNCTAARRADHLRTSCSEFIRLPVPSSPSVGREMMACGVTKHGQLSLSNPPNFSTNTSPTATAAIPQTIGLTSLPNSLRTSSNVAQGLPEHGLKPEAIVGITVGDLAGIGVLAIVILFVYQLKKKKKANSADK
ncbi:putative LRR receptor-like serine/threonine-protein kinase [Abeliophyllum distichum]|uniref:LRR receptor-like serine/threonine-protein kinase n=1 Tax=Abeliophyllum distichum TaxID=126358 RepID=A0ABD1P0K8_9LAMI